MDDPVGSEPLDREAGWRADLGPEAEAPAGTAGRRAFDTVLAAAVVILGILTIVTLLPGQRFTVDNSTLDITLNTLTAVAAAGAAALAWIRYRVDSDIAAIYESSAFLVLCVTRALIVGIAAFGSADQLGMSLDAPQQWPIYAWSFARLASALLLIAAAGTTLRRSPGPRMAAGALEVSFVLGLLAIFVGLHSIESGLPPLLGPRGFAALRGDTSAVPGMELLGTGLQTVVGLAYVVGALLYRRLFREQGRRYASYLAIALVVAAFSQVHWATFPGIYRPLVTVDDLLRALFSVILLLAIEAQFRGDVRALRLANARLRRLRDADAERLTLEASARLAREVHDGLSQDLWLVKLNHARIAAMRDLPPAAQPLVTELGLAVERALEDSRSVVASLRADSPVLSFGDTIRRLVADFEDRTGVHAEFATVGSVPGIGGADAAELVQIVREALANVSRHADAMTVRVTLSSHDSVLEIAVVDNGRGFEAAAGDGATFGIRGMRERAALIGAELQILSRPADGTRVVVSVPLRGAQAGGALG